VDSGQFSVDGWRMEEVFSSREDRTMLETLAGRLKWERTEDGIRVEIPDPALFAEFLGIAVAAGLPFVVYGLFGGFHGPARGWVLAIVGAVGLLLATPHGMELVGRKRLVILTSAALTVTILERCGESRTQLTYTVWNLRSNPRVSLTGKKYPEQIQVGIDSTSGTWIICSRLAEAEAVALISKMMEVFVFPEWIPAYKAAVSQESGSLRG
jgi:hypothetical protein